MKSREGPNPAEARCLTPNGRLEKRTFQGKAGTSEMGHVWTAPGWQGISSRSRLGRSSHVFGLSARFT
jgi:hypothetical protein